MVSLSEGEEHGEESCSPGGGACRKPVTEAR